MGQSTLEREGVFERTAAKLFRWSAPSLRTNFGSNCSHSSVTAWLCHSRNSSSCWDGCTGSPSFSPFHSSQTLLAFAPYLRMLCRPLGLFSETWVIQLLWKGRVECGCEEACLVEDEILRLEQKLPGNAHDQARQHVLRPPGQVRVRQRVQVPLVLPPVQELVEIATAQQASASQQAAPRQPGSPLLGQASLLPSQLFSPSESTLSHREEKDGRLIALKKFLTLLGSSWEWAAPAGQDGDEGHELDHLGRLAVVRSIQGMQDLAQHVEAVQVLPLLVSHECVVLQVTKRVLGTRSSVLSAPGL